MKKQSNGMFFMNLLFKLWLAGNLVYVTYNVLSDNNLNRDYLYGIFLSTAIYIIGIALTTLVLLLIALIADGNNND